MKQLFSTLAIALLFLSCDKDLAHYDDVFEVHFKFNGKEYSKTIAKNTPNPLVVSTFEVSPGIMYESQGALFELNDTSNITLSFGNFLRKVDDNNNGGNTERLKQMLPIGNREYNLLNGDSTITNGVAISFIDGRTNWLSAQWDAAKQNVKPVTTEQTGSTFIINEIKQTDYIAGSNNAFIIKGTFNCNLYAASANNEKKALTDGTFTVILSTR